LVLQMPLGVIYVTIWSILVGFGVVFLIMPVLQETFGLPIMSLGADVVFAPTWALPFFSLLGIVILTAFMHAAKGIGKLHGKYAKSMLVAQ
ncbi:MAG TPA: hypothetical protein VJ965_10280, partial [Anaerolineales bacterium]|nr:hypothetical protein [Anaerolineales bacterium]